MIKTFLSLGALSLINLIFGTNTVLAAADNVVITFVSEQAELVEYSRPSAITFELEATGENVGEVTWNVDGLPSGVTADFSDNPATGEAFWTTALTLTSDENTLPNVYTITVSAQGDGVGDISVTSFEYTVDPLTITAVGVSADSKVYDATDGVVLSGELEEVVGDDDVQVSGRFFTKTVGVGKEVELILSGSDAFKYTLEETLFADITPVTIMILAGDFAEDQSYYNGTTDAKLRLNPTGLVFDYVIEGDEVILEGGVAEFNDKHVGVGKEVMFSNFIAGGADGENYILDNQPANETQDVLPAEITIQAVSDTKKYDGTVSSDEDPEIVSGEVFAEDIAMFTQSFESEDVGYGKVVVPAGTIIDGIDGGNYLINFVSTDEGEITPAELTIENLQIETKIYDKTDTASITGEGSLVGVVDFDDVSFDVSVTTARFENERVGTNKEVFVDDINLTGEDAPNYVLIQPSLTGTILPRLLEVITAGVDKIFDGDTEAEVVFMDNRIEGDDIEISGVSTFADSLVGNNKEVTTTDIVISGTDALNYQANETATTSADITAVPKKKSSGSKRRFVFNTAPVGEVFGASTSTTLVSTTTTEVHTETSTSTATTTFQFLNNLYFGLSHNYDVSVLQQILIDGKLLAISKPTSYFGPLTEAAVKLYQVSKGIAGTGFVGPLTRAVLNKEL